MDNIRTLVQSLIKKYKTREPLEIANSLNIKVDIFHFSKIRGLVLKNDKEIRISINCKLPDRLRKVVLAHELGHVFLSKSGGYFFIDEHTHFNYSKEEIKANYFAAELLINDQKPYSGETIQNFAKRLELPLELVEIWVKENYK